MRAILVANGPLASETIVLLQAMVSDANLIIGVDGGTYHLLRLGITPHVVTGDFDSLAADDRARLANEGVQIYPTPNQDFTDLDKAIVAAIEVFGATEVRIFAASVGRLDHVYSVLSAVIKHGRRADIRLVDEVGETYLVPGYLKVTGADLPGRTLSLMAFGPVNDITTVGVRWPLSGESLAPGVRDGTLNEVVDEQIEVSVGSGDLLLMLHHPKPDNPPNS